MNRLAKFMMLGATVASLGLTSCRTEQDALDDAVEHELNDISYRATRMCLTYHCSDEKMKNDVAYTVQKAKLKYNTLDSMGQLDRWTNGTRYCDIHGGEYYITNQKDAVATWAMQEHDALHR